jgi:hypothetical protein
LQKAVARKCLTVAGLYLSLMMMRPTIVAADPITTPIPVSASLNTPLAEGWISSVCGGFIPEICVDPAYDHILEVDFDDGSSTQFLFDPEASGALSSIHEVRVRFVQLNGLPMTLQALNASFVPYSTTSFDLFETGGVLYEDFDFTEFNPAFYELSIPETGDFRLVGDGGLQFRACRVTDAGCIPTTSLPEPATGLLLLTGLMGPAYLRARHRQRQPSSTSR